MGKNNTPNFAKEIGDAAMQLFAESGEAVVYVRVAPLVYPFIAEATGKEIDFQVLYGNKSFEMYGLVLRCYSTDSEGSAWTVDKPFELITEALSQQQEVAQPDTLAVKIVRTWESCQSQCQEGFPCPLLQDIGTDLNGNVLDACSALRDVETLLGADEAGLDAAAEKFKNENGN